MDQAGYQKEAWRLSANRMVVNHKGWKGIGLKAKKPLETWLKVAGALLALFLDLFDACYRCYVDQMVVKIIRINLWEVVGEQGLEAEILCTCFCVLVSPVLRAVSSARATAMLAASSVQTWLGFCYTVSPDNASSPTCWWEDAMCLRCSGGGGKKKKRVENHDCNYREKKHREW